MVSTFGNNIVSAFTGGQSVKAIYTYGEKVWPVEPSEYYIHWSPTNLSGTFVIGGETRLLETYSGYYSGPFLSSYRNGRYYYVMDSGAFRSTDVVTVDTNLPIIGNNAFVSCTSLQMFSASECIRLDYGVPMNIADTFKGCTSLISVYLPKLSYVYGETFYHCDMLMDVNLQNCKGLGWLAFGWCSALTDIDLPKCSLIGESAFTHCTNLQNVYLGVCSTISQNAFESCTFLKTITIEYSGVCSGFGGALYYNPSVYVPAEWLSDYKSTYTSFRSLFFPITQ